MHSQTLRIAADGPLAAPYVTVIAGIWPGISQKLLVDLRACADVWSTNGPAPIADCSMPEHKAYPHGISSSQVNIIMVRGMKLLLAAASGPATKLKLRVCGSWLGRWAL
jgi:hypothetical protein